MKPTDFKDDEIVFNASSPGGTSLASDPNFMSAAFASQVVALSGIGKFSAIDLGKKLAGKAVRVSAAIGETSEGLTGHASPKDLETLFQLIYLHFTGAATRHVGVPGIQEPGGALSREPRRRPGRGVQRHRPGDDGAAQFSGAPAHGGDVCRDQSGQGADFYSDRFADASDFMFAFVGNVDTVDDEAARREVSRVAAVAHRKETFRDNGGGRRRASSRTRRAQGRGAEGEHDHRVHRLLQYAPETRFAIRAMMELFQIRAERNAARAAGRRV